MKEWLESLIRSMVKYPEEVTVQQNSGFKTVIFAIRVAEGDVGIVLGRKRRMIRALTSVAQLRGVKERMRYVLKIVE